MTQNELDKKGSEIIKTLARPYGSGSNRMDDLELQDLQTILAWHEWEDGMEFKDTLEIVDGNNPAFTDKKTIMDELVNTFGYKNHE